MHILVFLYFAVLIVIDLLNYIKGYNQGYRKKFFSGQAKQLQSYVCV